MSNEIPPAVPSTLSPRTRAAMDQDTQKAKNKRALDQLERAMPRNDQSDRENDAAFARLQAQSQQKPEHPVVRFFKAIGSWLSSLFGR